MSGTQDTNSPAQNSLNNAQEVQPGAEQPNAEAQEASPAPFSPSSPSASYDSEDTDSEKALTPSQKMDRLIRGSSSGYMKKELEKLRKEAAKYRSSSKEEEAQKLEIQAKAAQIQQELDSLKLEHRTLSIMRKLDKAGCVKSELVAKDIPADLDVKEGLDSFIEKYKEQNAFLFKQPKAGTIGGTFKASGAKNLTPSQQMDAYIRAALGR